MYDLAELPGLGGIEDRPHLVEVLGGLRGAAEGGQEEVEELLAEAGVGVAEEADAWGGGAGGGAEDGGIEAEEEAVGVHGALQLGLPLLLPIRRHGRRWSLPPALLGGGTVGARFRRSGRRRAPLELGDLARPAGVEVGDKQIGRAHV